MNIESLEAEISLMKTRKVELETLITFSPPEQTTLDIIRLNLKQHAEQLTWEMPELKGQLLKKYVERIDAVNQNTVLAISFKLTNPTQENSVLLTKTLAVEIKPGKD